MKRGDIWTVAGGADCSGKPCRPVIVTGRQFDTTPSIAICIFTTNPAKARLLRLLSRTTETGHTRRALSVVDKLKTVRGANSEHGSGVLMTKISFV